MASSSTISSFQKMNKPRVMWVDYAKGLGILLVVFYHVWKGLEKKISIPSDTFNAVNYLSEMIHMPLFFVATGLFVLGAARRSASVFITDKLLTIVYPYFVWSTIQYLIQYALAKATHSPTSNSLSDLPRQLLFDPVDQFWFLYALFLVLMVFILFVKLRISTLGIVLVGVVLFALRSVNLSFLGFHWHHYDIGLAYWGPFYQFLMYFVFVAAGAHFSKYLFEQATKLSSVVLWGLVILCLCVVLIGSFHLGIHRDLMLSYMGRGTAWAIGSCFGVAGEFSLAVLCERSGKLDVLRFLGQTSLEIFLMHVIFTSAFRQVLLKAHVISLPVHLVLGTAVGLIGPVVVVWLARKFNFSWIFSLKPR